MWNGHQNIFIIFLNGYSIFLLLFYYYRFRKKFQTKKMATSIYGLYHQFTLQFVVKIFSNDFYGIIIINSIEESEP